MKKGGKKRCELANGSEKQTKEKEKDEERQETRTMVMQKLAVLRHKELVYVFKNLWREFGKILSSEYETTINDTINYGLISYCMSYCGFKFPVGKFLH